MKRTGKLIGKRFPSSLSSAGFTCTSCMVINLEVRRFLDLEALEHGLTSFSFRLWTRVQFQTHHGWTAVLSALIDTGAPFSVLPKSVWSDIETRPVGFASKLRGLVPLPSAALPARLAPVTCRVSDEDRKSKRLNSNHTS